VLRISKKGQLQMATTHTTIRINSEAKAQFDEIVTKLGLSASSAFNLFVNATIQHQGLPFNVTLDPLAHPILRAKVEAELERRTAIADDPDTKWFTPEEARKELGL